MQDITLLINKKIEMADNENLNSENLDKNNKEQNNSTISKSTQNETKEEKSKEENSDAIKKKKMKSDSKTESPLKKDDDSIKSAPNQKTKSRIIKLFSLIFICLFPLFDFFLFSQIFHIYFLHKGYSYFQIC